MRSGGGHARAKLGGNAAQVPRELTQIYKGSAGLLGVRVVQGRTGFLVEVEVAASLREGYEGEFVLPGSFVHFRG